MTTTAGARTVSLNGVGVAATKSVLLTPATTNVIQFGTVLIGSTANAYPYSYALNIYNTGTDPVTFATAPTIQGTNAGDFSVAQNSCNTHISPQTSCYIYLQFKPTAAGSRTAVLSVTDDASTGNGVQTIALAGTGAFVCSRAQTTMGPVNPDTAFSLSWQGRSFIPGSGRAFAKSSRLGIK